MVSSKIHVLDARASVDGRDDAEVDCPRRKRPIAMGLCERCPECLHASRTGPTADWIVVCRDAT